VNKKENRGKIVKPLPSFKSSNDLPTSPSPSACQEALANGEWRTFKPTIDQKLCNKCGFLLHVLPGGDDLFR